MTDASYADIRRRLRAASGPGNQALARDAALLFREDEHAYPRIATLLMRAIVVGSLDAAIAVFRELMPGWGIEQISWSHDIGGPVIASVGNRGHGEAYRGCLSDDATTPALAVLSALFAALEAQHD